MNNFDKICRTCSSQVGEMKSLFNPDTSYLLDMIMEVTAIKIVKEDGYPANICLNCVRDLRSAYSFRRKCQASNAKFTLYINSHLKTETNQLLKVETQKQEDFCDQLVKIESPEQLEEFCGNNSNNSYIVENNQSRTTTPTKINDLLSKRKTRKVRARKILRKPNHACSVCTKSFIFPKALRAHMRVHTKEKPFSCKKCGRAFGDKSNLSRHNKIHTGELPHKCPICNKGFIQSPSLITHLQTHNRTEIPGSGKSRKTTQNRDNSKGEPCNICHRIYASKLSLKMHKLTHGEKMFLCSVCGKCFVSNASLQIHRTIHTGEKPYRCMVCNKTFRQVSSLNAHKLIHTGERPHVCPICNKTYTQPNHLKYHLRRHTGEKPYTCSVCDKTFTLNGTLTVHMRTHTGETPYICPTCGKGFYHLTNMKKHRARHGFEDNIAKT